MRQRHDLLIAGTHVVSMDPAVGDVPRADVLVRDGEIIEVGPHAGERAPDDVQVIEAAGTITLPGFVDTHWHLWNSLLRGTVGDRPGTDYFTVKRALASHFELDDFYWAARLGLAEAVNGGITTVHNFDHNVRGPRDADANIQAHLDSGLRGRFSYGPPDSAPSDRTNDLDDLARLRERWSDDHLDGRLDFGVALRGPYRTPPEVYEREWATARSLGLPMSLSLDTLAMPTSADILGHLRAIISVEAARTGSPVITPRRLLRLATIDGAKDLGLHDTIGSITPGKRADLVILRSSDVNLVPSGDPVEALVYTGQIDNIDTVIADGRVLKRHGRLVPADDEIDPVVMAAARRDALLRRAAAAGDWRWPAAPTIDPFHPGPGSSTPADEGSLQ